ncbi:HIT family protein [Paludisphaera mucosa]|uniref:HIT domain-containing protein n=1 Tax=Paludisphaera mucosa TaxID=3030827 RepID=A0ABT6F696_9BACT|nr:HIT domain-containing protein [Paludisphaera mucosa]MDG3003095.1 HIT domain-containing protein [Paludisphaera mucosa]
MLDRIWAPWRAQYVSGAVRDARTDSACFLCTGLAEDRDAENLIAWRGRETVVVLNRYPYNNGHLLIAPTNHKGTLQELNGSELVEPIETIRWMISILDRMMRPQGYNVGLNQGKAAGAGLPGHLHWHVVPRWDGDVNFMPVLAETKVITESLGSFHDRLRSEIELDRRAGVGL